MLSPQSKLSKYLPWALSVFIAFVFVQSLFFKFTNAPETQYIFGTLDQWGANTLGVEGLFLGSGPFNQYVIATAELIASILLIAGLVTSYKVLNGLGAIMSLGVISGAIFFHLFTPLGVDVQGDGGALFGMAVGISIASLILIYLRKNALCQTLRSISCCSKCTKS